MGYRGKERGRPASVVAISAVLESSDGGWDWEVTAQVADGEGLEQPFGGRCSRTWR